MGSFGFCPAGVHVLVVNGDNKELRSLERKLTNCNYKVTTCNLAEAALYVLGNKNEEFMFDIIMTDVNLSDMDGFEFVKYISLNFEIPVIIMSRDEETSKVMKGVECGACDYLVKPIRRKDLQYIWLHVFKKRMQIQYQFEDSLITGGSISGKKRKDLEIAGGFSSSAKKPKLIWIPELHNKFVKAVDEIGIDKATPKLIQNLMKEPSVTREHISSHLQKHKQKMSRTASVATQNFPAEVSTACSTHTEQNLDFNAPSSSSSSRPAEESTTDPNVSAAVPSDANDFLEPSFFDFPSTEEEGAECFGFKSCMCMDSSCFCNLFEDFL